MSAPLTLWRTSIKNKKKKKKTMMTMMMMTMMMKIMMKKIKMVIKMTDIWTVTAFAKLALRQPTEAY
nr:hypothetical protein BaRGS_018201 [Batillaria attramentaria]